MAVFNKIFHNRVYKPTRLKPKTLMMLTSTVALVSKKWSARLALHLLFKPNGRRDYTFKTHVQPIKTYRIKSLEGVVALHHFKADENKHVLLSHGWADSSVRFAKLIDCLMKEGYNVWALDHIGHGQSSGDISHLFGFVHGLREALKFIEYEGHEIKALVGHSMGAVAVLNQEAYHLKGKKVVMLSAPTKLFENLFENTQKNGVSSKILMAALEHLSSVYDVAWSALSPDHHTHKIGPNFLMVHDKYDTIASYENFKKLVEHTNHEFLTTEVLGHSRAVKDKVVLKRISDFIKSN